MENREQNESPQMQRKKAEILKAAVVCFDRYGYDKTTLDDVGKQAGLNKATLFYYYKNKESLFSDVITSELRDFLAEVLKKVYATKGHKNKILKYLKELFTCSEGFASFKNIFSEKSQVVRPIFLSLKETVTGIQAEQIAGILESGIQAKEFAMCDTKKVAMSIIIVAQAIRTKGYDSSDCSRREGIDSSDIENEMVFTVSLLLDGLAMAKDSK
jgi:AcrR family transcriptional regulator